MITSVHQDSDIKKIIFCAMYIGYLLYGICCYNKYILDISKRFILNKIFVVYLFNIKKSIYQKSDFIVEYATYYYIVILI